MRRLNVLLLAASLVTFVATADARVLTAAERARMTGASWSQGCPVPLSDLVAVEVTYLGFDGRSHTGDIVVHKLLGAEVAEIFRELYAAKFPIERVDAWEKYGPDVYAEKNVTVGFYCEKADDAPNEWSSHAYGFAIDVNPKLNPFLGLNQRWWPSISAQYVQRDSAPGKVSTSSEVFNIFTRHGWLWGGFDKGVPDYMHFNKLSAGDGPDRLKRPYLVNSLQFVPGNDPNSGIH